MEQELAVHQDNKSDWTLLLGSFIKRRLGNKTFGCQIKPNCRGSLEHNKQIWLGSKECMGVNRFGRRHLQVLESGAYKYWCSGDQSHRVSVSDEEKHNWLCTKWWLIEDLQLPSKRFSEKRNQDKQWGLWSMSILGIEWKVLVSCSDWRNDSADWASLVILCFSLFLSLKK